MVWRLCVHITNDGRYVVFDSYETNILLDDINLEIDVYRAGNLLLCSDPTVATLPPFCQAQSVTPTPTTPASCPWGGTVVTPEPGANNPVKCQYTFNAQQRHKAAEYAVNWAAGACPMFCAFNYYPYVTPSPLYPTPQYGYDCANPSQTDCANFVSQAYLYAGWPMTNDWYCAINPNSNLCEPGHSSHPGWSYAGAIGENSRGLAAYAYYTLGGYDLCVEIGLINTINGDNACKLSNFDVTYQNKIQPPLSDSQKADVLSGLNNEPNANSDLVLSEYSLPRLLSSIDELSDFRTAMDFLEQDFKLSQGDLLYSRVLNKQHVAIVVGWGPYVETWAQLAQVNPTDIVRTRDALHPVPYVVDHGLQGQHYRNYASAIAPNSVEPKIRAMGSYKPYYALHWRTKRDDLKNTLAGNLYFVHVPNDLIIPFDKITNPDSQIQNLPSTMLTVCPLTTPLP